MGRKTSVHEQLNMCFGCTKTHLRAYVTFKIFPGLYPGPPLKGRGGVGREGRRREGRGGKEGNGLPTQSFSVKSCLSRWRAAVAA
jgi:hypothetical protein